MDGGSPFEKVRYNAFWHNAHLDTTLSVNRGQMEDTLNHLDDCIKNPTIGLLARREAAKNVPNYDTFYRNEQTMFSYPEVRRKNSILERRIEALYPRTADLRNKLIDSKRVILRYVKPKMSMPRKLILKFLGI